MNSNNIEDAIALELKKVKKSNVGISDAIHRLDLVTSAFNRMNNLENALVS